MLSDQHFYFKLIRKYVIVFGNMFNNLTIVRMNPDSTDELQRIKVPISYAPKDKYVTRLTSDPDLTREVGSILPRMSFEMVGLTYNAARQQNPTLKQVRGASATGVSSQYMGVPYDIEFVLNIYTKNLDDSTQIIEQILPHFCPDYTPTIAPIAELAFLKDTAIVLDSVSPEVTYEGDWNSVRYVMWTLKFSVKGYFYGPISSPKIIRKAITNIYNDPSLVAGYVVKINTDTGNNGNFKIDDIVFQGDNYSTANAYATVVSWNKDNQKLILSGAQGQFLLNNEIKAVSTNASYRISSFDASPIKLVEIVNEPDPITAQPDDDFGFTTTIKEWPETEL